LTHLEVAYPQQIVKKYALNGAFLKAILDVELAKILLVSTNTSIGAAKMRFILHAIFENPRFFDNLGYQSWKKPKVENFIKNVIELPQYVKQFNGVFGALLPHLANEECLKELRITPEHFKSFETAFLNVENEIMSVAQVYKWAKDLKIDPKECENIRKYGIHSAMLLMMNDTEIYYYFPSLEKNRLKKNTLISEMETLSKTYNVTSVRPRLLVESRSEVKQLNSYQPVQENLIDNSCVVCMDRDRAIVTLPCNHMVMCEECAEQLTQCPTCRADIKDTIKPYM
jgi:hypothetical protein